MSSNKATLLQMQDAYRRVGHRLSQRVCGAQSETSTVNSHSTVASSSSLSHGGGRTSAFSPPVRVPLHHPTDSSASSSPSQGPNQALNSKEEEEILYDRSAKVAKIAYGDHGDHGSHSPKRESILRKLTQHAKETYEKSRRATPTEHVHKAHRNHAPPQDQNPDEDKIGLSPHRQALSQLAIRDDDSANDSTLLPRQKQQPQDQANATSTSDEIHVSNMMNPPQKGLLQAALEEQSHTSSTGSPKQKQRSCAGTRKCLTQPSEPVSNGGLDNADGNLIVYQGDIFRIPACATSAKKEYTVLGPLGQGTFAQVFHCIVMNPNTNKVQDVAVKIVKNKPAYTRQAAVEIDVFRVLREARVTEKHHMVQLQCSFTYQNHLCLVFEMMGLNLYEVLKKRQFRGLPLGMVRRLVQQAMEGVKDLSQKSIVHCDLKPENILLCIDDGVMEAVVNAGERTAAAVVKKKAGDGDVSDENNKSSSSCMDVVGSGTPSTEDTCQTSSEGSSHQSLSTPGQMIKLIDFGSACFEGHTSHTYIQSRFYRSPEVLIGLPYDSAIDMWSLGCVAAELFLGLPILPGVHEHDQLGRLCEMIGPLPDWMLEQGSKSNKYFVKQFLREDAQEPKTAEGAIHAPTPKASSNSGSPPPAKMSWRIKTLKEYIHGLSPHELKKKGGIAKLEKQPSNRYFKRTRLADILMMHGHSASNHDKEALGLFVHFLLGILDPDPWKRWTAYQASMHPFLTGSTSYRRRSGVETTVTGGAHLEGSLEEFDIYWVPPWDPSICRRKLLNVQKTREKQQAMRRKLSNGSRSHHGDASPRRQDSQSMMRTSEPASPAVSGVSNLTSTVADPRSLHRQASLPVDMGAGNASPPATVSGHAARHSFHGVHPQYGSMSGSVGAPATPSGMIVGSYPNAPYVMASSLTDSYHPGMMGPQNGAPAMLMASPAMLGTAGYGNAVYLGQQVIQGVSGPQSFTGVTGYESLSQIPMEADFGYALQRPGVVPGMGGDLSSSMTMSSSTMGQSPMMAYSPQQWAVATGRAGSLTMSHSVGPLPGLGGRRRHTYSAQPQQGTAGGLAPASFLQPTSIREVGTDYQLGPPETSVLSSSLQTSSQGSTTSLLAQQLEAQSHSSSVQMQDTTGAMMQVPGTQTGNHPPQYVGGPDSYSASTNPGYYYSNYMTPGGVGMMMNSYLHTGSYPENAPQQMTYNIVGPPSTSFQQPQQYPPSSYQQYLDRTRAQPPARPPPRYQGMSM